MTRQYPIMPANDDLALFVEGRIHDCLYRLTALAGGIGAVPRNPEAAELSRWLGMAFAFVQNEATRHARLNHLTTWTIEPNQEASHDD